MTIAQEIILRNADAGITFYRDHDALKWDPPVSFTPEQLRWIDRYTPEILAHVDAEADEVLALLELPCARLGPKEMAPSRSALVVIEKTVVEAGTQTRRARNATAAPVDQGWLVRSE